MDVLQWARHFRYFPGQGQFDLVDFFEQVLRAGYTGPLSLEIFNDVFRETPNRRTAVDAMRSLLYLESEARSAWPRRRQTRRRGAALERVELFDPPAAPRSPASPSSSSRVDDDGRGALGALLRQLGLSSRRQPSLEAGDAVSARARSA